MTRRIGREALRITLLLILIPFHEVLTGFWTATRPWSDGLAALGAAAVLVFLLRTPREERSGFELPALAFAGVLLASAVWNRVPLPALLAGLRAQLPWVALGLLALRLFRDDEVDGLLRSLVAAATLLCAYGLVSFIFFKSIGGPGPLALPANPAPWLRKWLEFWLHPYSGAKYGTNWHLESTFGNDNYFGIWLVLLAPIALQQCMEEAPGARRWGRLASLAMLLVSLSWTYSRTALAALVLSGVVCAVRRFPKALLLMVPVLLALPVAWTGPETRRFVNVSHTEGGRVRMVHRAAAAVKRNPLLGAGPGTVRLADVDYARLASETGLLGLLCFGWLVISAMKPALRHKPGNPGSARETALLAGLVAGAGAAVTAGVWENPQVASTYWVLAGLLATVARVGRDPAAARAVAAERLPDAVVLSSEHGQS